MTPSGIELATFRFVAQQITHSKIKTPTGYTKWYTFGRNFHNVYSFVLPATTAGVDINTDMKEKYLTNCVSSIKCQGAD